MANVMIQYNENGALSLYLPKKDLEEVITYFEFDSDSKWGGEVRLANGAIYHIDPMATKPKLPITVKARRLQAA
ncbi:putative nitrogen fixation protein NifT [Vibrio plantisponsor]|uniref:Nitrogen fixation protein NifT n=3 Tax=Vibrio TaxID=662 RepID=A0A2J8I7P1_VIBDI|nr:MULTISPECIES: putative nitrogen fixation protein NifT [Vibrio]MCF7362352.1 putative nitrogen fixation protein NifT [Vibrio sp. A1-b2]MCZ4371615.1 putative nitrogen fixation protein NifT [Vibrio diazotrophicus]MDW6019546.1 putative nitrogen fixation protein NifT [Vibrio plantisponsor]NNM39125.1 putative nitrogen fixation protein NifT [Vibrio plantisponsor]PNH90985.1 putative nitrogen fixation protein NifT [Vibrio diazotrophicus]